MNKINYQLVLDKELEKIIKSGKTPTLLLHACCAPCSSYSLEYLSDYFDIILYYYNPNISPESEYSYRLSELHRLTETQPYKHKVIFTEAEYNPDKFYELVKGHENDPERGKRCRICLYHRIEAAAIKAKELGTDYFTTTLSISPMKDAQFLNAAGGELAEKYGVNYLFSDFKKRGGYIRSIELSHKYNLYRQDFCGCIFSKAERERIKAQAKVI